MSALEVASDLIIPIVLAIPPIFILLAVFLVRSIRRGSSSWRDVAARAALGFGLLAGLILLGFIVRIANWGDPTAPAGSLLGPATVMRWGRWGFLSAVVAFVSALAAQRWERIVSLFGSLLLASFWLFAYIVTEAQ
jgi:hypothetical protein